MIQVSEFNLSSVLIQRIFDMKLQVTFACTCAYTWVKIRETLAQIRSVGRLCRSSHTSIHPPTTIDRGSAHLIGRATCHGLALTSQVLWISLESCHYHKKQALLQDKLIHHRIIPHRPTPMPLRRVDACLYMTFI